MLILSRRGVFLTFLRINPTKILVASFSHKTTTLSYEYSLDNIPLKRASCTHDLGILVDSRLTFEQHVSSIVNASYRKLGLISRMTKKFTNVNCVVLLYSSSVRTKLEFSSVVWNCINLNNVAKIGCVQWRLIRILHDRLLGHHVFYACARVLRMFNITPLEIRRKYRDYLFLHKLIHNHFSCLRLLSAVTLCVPRPSLRNYSIFYVNSSCTSDAITRLVTQQHTLRYDLDIFILYLLTIWLLLLM